MITLKLGGSAAAPSHREWGFCKGGRMRDGGRFVTGAFGSRG